MKRECSGLRGISSSCTLDLGTEVFPCLPQVPGEAATTGQRPGRWWGVGMCRSPSPPQLWPEEPRPEEGLRGVSPHGLPLPLSTASYFPKPESRQRSDGGKGVRRLVFPFARSQLVPMGREKGSAQVGAGLPSLSGPDDPAQPGDTGHLPLQHPLFKEGVSARGPGVPTQEVMERPPPPQGRQAPHREY